MNILLADDSVPAQNMGKKILMDAGYGVVTVNNGLEALRKIAETVPDIAILDIFMPGYTGLEICKRLRSSPATAAIPVILTVGKLEPYRPEDGEQVQSNAVIVKPFAAAELISAVRSLIGGPLADVVAPPPQAMVGDPLQQSPLGADAVDLRSPLAAVPTATPEPSAQTFLEEADEPLFASDPFEASGNAAGLTGDAPSVYSAESPFGTDSNAPASLAFDPDAKQTPFSASAIELFSPAAQSAPEGGASAFTEFDLAPETGYTAPESGYAASELEMLPLDEPSFPTPAAPHSAPEQEVAQEAAHVGLLAPTGLDADKAAVLLPESLAAPEPFASASPAAAEPESALNIPALDPFLELPEASVPTAASESSILQVGEGQAAEEEARKAAFEALFNSTEELPLDNIPASPAATAPVALQGVAELPESHTHNSEPEIPQPEFNPLADGLQQHLAPSPLDPNPLDPNPFALNLANEPPTSIAATPDLLEHHLPDLLGHASPSTELSEADSEWKPEQAIASVSTSLDLPPLGEAVGLTPTLPEVALAPESVPVEAQPILAEAPPETPGAHEPIAPAALMPALLGLAASALQARPEFVHPDFVHPEAVPNEAVPNEAAPHEAVPPELPEVVHSGAEMPLPNPAHLEAPPAQVLPAQVEDAPVQVPVHLEAPPVQVSVPAEAEPQQPAQLQPEQPMGEICSPPGLTSRLNEAERIHHAIERVFDRFKPLLVAAIVRELARQDHD
jgi:CheY-like chemotaxis protein